MILVSGKNIVAPKTFKAIKEVLRKSTTLLRLPKNRVINVALVSKRRMRQINRAFLGRDYPTDVISFRYQESSLKSMKASRAGSEDAPLVVGDILVCPKIAAEYAKRNRVPYVQELSRYVIHGLLHWRGLRDETPLLKRRMRNMEDMVLTSCGFKEGKTALRRSGGASIS